MARFNYFQSCQEFAHLRLAKVLSVLIKALISGRLVSISFASPEPCSTLSGVVVKLVITSACHAEGRGFESRPPRQFSPLKRESWLAFEDRHGKYLRFYGSTVLLVSWWSFVQNPYPSSIQQSKPIVFKALISKSSVLIELCEPVVSFGSSIGQPGLKIREDLGSPFHQGFSQGFDLF